MKTMKTLTKEQFMCARVALGLPNDRKVTSQNYAHTFVGSRFHTIWEEMVELGFAKDGTNAIIPLPPDNVAYFHMTASGAAQVLIDGETLSEKYFPEYGGNDVPPPKKEPVLTLAGAEVIIQRLTMLWAESEQRYMELKHTVLEGLEKIDKRKKPKTLPEPQDRTIRGFAIYEKYLDGDSQEITLLRSGRFDPERAVYFKIKPAGFTSKETSTLLDVEQAKKIIAGLQAFVDGVE